MQENYKFKPNWGDEEIISVEKLHEVFRREFPDLKTENDVSALTGTSREKYLWFRAVDRAKHFSRGHQAEDCPLNDIFGVETRYATFLSHEDDEEQFAGVEIDVGHLLDANPSD